MAVDNIARALAAKAIAGGGAGSVTPEDLEKSMTKLVEQSVEMFQFRVT